MILGDWRTTPELDGSGWIVGDLGATRAVVLLAAVSAAVTLLGLRTCGFHREPYWSERRQQEATDCAFERLRPSRTHARDENRRANDRKRNGPPGVPR